MAEDFTKDDLLGRWLGGTLSEAEELALKARPDFAEYEQLIRQVDGLGKPAFNAKAALARQKSLRAGKAKEAVSEPADGGADAGAKRGKEAKIRRLKVYRWAGVAASLMLLIAVAWWSINGGDDFFQAAAGATKQATLSDGSSVRLNSGSELSYADEDSGRTASLRGEAFFQIVKDGRPFRVKTDYGEVAVLGTSFNVFSRDGVMQVSCTTGKVSVSFLDHPKTYTLTPGLSVSIEATGLVEEPSASSDAALDWLDGQSVFRDRPLREILAELERQFDLQIEVPAELDLQRLVTTTFPNNSVAAALDIALTPLEEISYTHTGQRIVIRMK